MKRASPNLQNWALPDTLIVLASSRNCFLLLVGENRRVAALRDRSYCLPASLGLRRRLAERFSVQHSELPEFRKAKLHGGLRYCYFLFRQEDAPDLGQSKVLDIAIRPDTANLAEGSRQSALVDLGYAAQVCYLDECSYICPRNLLEMIDNLSIPLGSLSRSNRGLIVPAALGCGYL